MAWRPGKIDDMVGERIKATEPVKVPEQISVPNLAVMTDSVDFEGDEVIVPLRPHLVETLARFNGNGTWSEPVKVEAETTMSLKTGMKSIDLPIQVEIVTDDAKGNSMSRSSSEDLRGGTFSMIKATKGKSQGSPISTSGAT